MTGNQEFQFNPGQHALLFAWTASEVIERAGQERGQAAVRKAVRKYGEQRGSRMAMRAMKDGLALDMTAYMAYGEWQAQAGAFESSMDTPDGMPRSLIFRCPWHEAWVANGINEAGRLYCLEIDPALARGFNPQVHLEVTGTRSNGAAACEFIYHQADLEALHDIQVDKTQTVMGWAYHIGHLYKTMREVLILELGEIGAASSKAGLQKFSEKFGRQAAEEIERYLEVDFDRLPIIENGGDSDE